MLFVPLEPAYMIAMQHDTSLWEYAYKKRILLISPTNLIAALKLVADLWQREQQNKNAIEVTLNLVTVLLFQLKSLIGWSD
jgi:DNA recombination protein RmuC